MSFFAGVFKDDICVCNTPKNRTGKRKIVKKIYIYIKDFELYLLTLYLN